MLFDEFFAKMPFLPMTEVARHLTCNQIIALSIHSDRWRDAIKRCTFQTETTMSLFIEEKKVEVDLHFTPHKNGTKKKTLKIKVCFRENNVEVMEEDGIEYTKHSIQVHSTRFADIEDRCHEFVLHVATVFDPDYGTFRVALPLTPVDRTLRLLAQLPRGIETETMSLAWPKQPVQIENLMRTLEFVPSDSHVHVHQWMDGEVETRTTIYLTNDRRYWKFENPRRIMKESIETINCHVGEFGVNEMTSANFNALLKNWKEGYSDNIKSITFLISEDQKINIEEVLEGLDAKEWDPERRDRTYLKTNSFELTSVVHSIDLRHGMDIFNEQGQLGTVRLTKDELLFLVWDWSRNISDRFPVRNLENRLSQILDFYVSRIPEYVELVKGFDEKLVEQPENADVVAQKAKVLKNHSRALISIELATNKMEQLRNEF